MVRIKGETHVDYFTITCVSCGNPVAIERYRWVGGVPQIDVSCSTCKEHAEFKLPVQNWIKALPPESA